MLVILSELENCHFAQTTQLKLSNFNSTFQKYRKKTPLSYLMFYAKVNLYLLSDRVAYCFQSMEKSLVIYNKSTRIMQSNHCCITFVFGGESITNSSLYTIHTK